MSFLYVLFLFALGYCSFSHAQQPYLGNAVTDCSYTDDSALGYTCNGVNITCQAYLVFRSRPSYNDVSSISNLLGSDPSQLSEINSASVDATFETDRLVIVPATCSCSGQYYQENTTYVVQSGDTPYTIAYNLYQGLSTCQAIKDQNRKNGTIDIFPGERMNIPLRCACATKSQADSGINYLLSYPVTSGDVPSLISARFGADPATTLKANGLNFSNTKIFPLTTLLIPLQDPPNSSQTAEPSPPLNSSPPPSTPPGPNKSSDNTWIYVLVSTVGGILLLISGIIIFVAFFRGRNKEPSPVNTSESLDGGPQTQEFNELNAATNNSEAVNGPLSDWIYSSNNSRMFLNWNQRIQIALDVAKGLNFLHRLTNARAHNNINSSNVLLDCDLRAKIGNVSMTRSREGEETCLEDDIYAFGILMLDIITGKKAAALQTQEHENLSDMLSNVVAEDAGHGRLNQIIDDSMEGNYPPEQASFTLRLIHSCLNESREARPSMNEVEHSLTRIFSNSTMELSSNFSAYQSTSMTA